MNRVRTLLDEHGCAARYRCRYCDRDKWLPERALDHPRTVRTGCRSCERITPHHHVGEPKPKVKR